MSRSRNGDISPANSDPHKALVVAMAVRGLRELAGRDICAALDAFVWFAFGDGPTYLQAADFEVGEIDILRVIAHGGLRNVLRS